jgi:tRNA threonylcarbamoyl adenosine modification protein YeaZ
VLVLGLDTSTPAVSAALVSVTAGGQALLAESVAVDGRRHGELLASGIAAVLRQAGASRRELGAVVVGLGPGPFTGLRVGIVTAAALSDALAVPAYGVCSLDGLVVSGPVVAVTDARRREVYWARYDAGGARTEGPAVDRPADLAPRLEGHQVVGDGALLHADVLGPVAAGPRYPSAALLVRRVAGRVLAGAPSDPLTPLYLRRPDAVEPGAGKKVTAARSAP